MKNKRAAIITGAVILVVIILVAVVLYMSTQNQEEAATTSIPSDNTTGQQQPSDSGQASESVMTLTYTDQGFIPKDLSLSNIFFCNVFCRIFKIYKLPINYF